MSELVGYVADAVALVVEAGGDGLAEDVAADPGVADPVERLAEIGLGVWPASGSVESRSWILMPR